MPNLSVVLEYTCWMASKLLITHPGVLHGKYRPIVLHKRSANDVSETALDQTQELRWKLMTIKERWSPAMPPESEADGEEARGWGWLNIGTWGLGPHKVGPETDWEGWAVFGSCCYCWFGTSIRGQEKNRFPVIWNIRHIGKIIHWYCIRSLLSGSSCCGIKQEVLRSSCLIQWHEVQRL